MVKNKSIHIFVLLMLCLACILSLCACSHSRQEKTVIHVFSDQSLESCLPRIGDKFLVTNDNNYDLQYVFEEADTLETRILSGETCDLIITSSDSVMKELVTEGKVFKEESIPIAKSQMILITSSDNGAFSSMNDLFLHIDPDLLEIEPEGYQRYTDLLWDTYGEEGWQDEWYELEDLWIRSDFAGIAIYGLQKEEGVYAQTILNRDGETYDLLERAQMIHFFGVSADIISSVLDHHVTVGICCMTDLDGEPAVKVLECFDRSEDPARIYQVGRITESEHKTEAKEWICFLQGDHARRFFEDFGFEVMR